MIMKRFVFVVMLMAMVVGFCFPAMIQAQSYPNRPIQVIHTGAPGQTIENAARIMLDELEKVTGAKFVLTGKPGASMTLGTDAVVRSKNDGYTICYTTATALLYAPVAEPKIVPYDGFRDLEPLGGKLILPFTVTVQAESPWKTFAELIDYGKKNPGKIRLGAVGIGSTESFNNKLIENLTGAKMTLVPTSVHPQISLLGGHIEAIGTPTSEVYAQVAAGKFRVLLLSSKYPKFPNVPTLVDLGYSQNILESWHSFFAPAGIPDEARKLLVNGIQKVFQNPAVRAKLENLDVLVEYRSPAEFKKIWEGEYKTVKEIGASLGLGK
jgi:tripartite-type tricarboxylate transporter receptor subunit TctC